MFNLTLASDSARSFTVNDQLDGFLTHTRTLDSMVLYYKGCPSALVTELGLPDLILVDSRSGLLSLYYREGVYMQIDNRLRFRSTAMHFWQRARMRGFLQQSYTNTLSAFHPTVQQLVLSCVR